MWFSKKPSKNIGDVMPGIFGDVGRWINEMGNSASRGAIVESLKKDLSGCFSNSGAEISKLEKEVAKAIDNIYRHLMTITSFDENSQDFFSGVAKKLTELCRERGVKVMYVLDNELRKDRFMLACEAFALAGISVVTPYTKKLRDQGTDDLFSDFDRKRMLEKKPSTAYAVESLIGAPNLGYFPETHYLELDEVMQVLKYEFNKGEVVVYIEKNSTVNYLEDVIKAGASGGYTVAFRNDVVTSSNIKIYPGQRT